MIKISGWGMVAIATCIYLSVWTYVGASKPQQSNCAIAMDKYADLQRLLKKKANLKDFESELGSGCRVPLEPEIIYFWRTPSNKIVSVQFQSKNNKFVKHHVKKVGQRSKKAASQNR